MARNVSQRLNSNTHQWEQDGIETLLQKYSGGILLAQTVPTGSTRIIHFIRLPETAAEKLYEAIAAWHKALAKGRSHSYGPVALHAGGLTYEAASTQNALEIRVAGGKRAGALIAFSPAEANRLYRSFSRALPEDEFAADGMGSPPYRE